MFAPTQYRTHCLRTTNFCPKLSFSTQKRHFHGRTFSQINNPTGVEKQTQIKFALCLVTNSLYVRRPAEFVGEFYSYAQEFFLAGGDMLQLRFSQEEVREHLELATLILMDMETWSPKAKLVINDRPDVALAAINNSMKLRPNSHRSVLSKKIGVHLGPKDFPPQEASELLGKDCPIGYTVYTSNDILFANKHDAITSLGVQVYPSESSYPDSIKYWNISGLKKVKLMAPNKNIMAIGGINQDNVTEVLDCLGDGDGVAIIGDIFRANDVSATTKRYRQLLDTKE